MTDAVVISDPYRAPIVAQKRNDSDGGVVLRPAGRSLPIMLPEAELDRLFAFARGKPHIQRFPAVPKGPL
jgi:hypothetical protein